MPLIPFVHIKQYLLYRSTGYFKGEHIVGADPELIKMMVKEAKGRIKVKGSGCVRSQESFS